LITHLVQFREQWYRVKGDCYQPLGYRSVLFFNIILTFSTNGVDMIKNKTDPQNNGQCIIDMLKMKLFAEGKTLDDLPTYHVDINAGAYQLKLCMDADKNLIGVSAHDPMDPVN